MKYKTFKGVAEQKDLGWFISCDVIDPYSQVPRMLSILKMQLFDFELIEGSEYQYEIHLLQGSYVALLLPITDHVPDAKKMVEITDIEISKVAHKHGYEEHSFFTASTSNQKRLSFFAGAKWYRQQLKERQ